MQVRLHIKIDARFKEFLYNATFAGRIQVVTERTIDTFIEVDDVAIAKDFSGHDLEKPSFQINDKDAFYPDTLLSQVWYFSRKEHIIKALTAYDLFHSSIQWTAEDLVVFFEILTAEVIKHNRHLLATDEYIKTVAQSQTTLSFSSVHNILTQLLKQGISLKNAASTSAAISESASLNLSEEEITEDLIDKFSAGWIEILITAAYFKAITLSGTEDDKSSARLTKEGLYYELGIYFPEIKFTIDDSLPRNYFCVKLNELQMLPVKGLEADEVLVNEKASVLNKQWALEVINPANANVCTIIKASDGNEGIFSWTAIGFIFLATSNLLRNYSALFIHKSSTARMLNKLSPVYPALSAAVLKLRTVAFITLVLRLLTKEGFSIRPLSQILQSMLEFDYVVADSSEKIVFDDRLPSNGTPDVTWLNNAVNVCSYIRSHFKNYISHKYTRGQSTLTVYLVDQEIEKILRSNQLLDEESKKIIEATKLELGLETAFDTSQKNILTTEDVRPVLKNMLQYALPHVNIIAYQELAPAMNIQPVARITLN